jgi:hypothetical protein
LGEEVDASGFGPEPHPRRCRNLAHSVTLDLVRVRFCVVPLCQPLDVSALPTVAYAPSGHLPFACSKVFSLR